MFPLIVFILWSLYLLYMIRCVSRIPCFEICAVENGASRVSVIIAVKDQATTIEKTLESIFQLTGLYEAIIIDDRSTDGTSDVLEAATKKYKNLKVVTIQILPEGWLGKVNALKMGTEIATGDILLYSDGDVLFEPDVLVRISTLMKKHDLDHLSVFPHFEAPLIWPRVFCLTVIQGMIQQWIRPWGGKLIGARDRISMGPCNAVKRESFLRTKGWEWLKMEVMEDIGLSFLMQNHGLRTSMMLSQGSIRFEWYQTVSQVMSGMQKNLFSGVGYLNGIIGSTRGIIHVSFVLLFLTLPFFASAQIWITLYVFFAVQAFYISKRFNQPFIVFFFFPIGALGISGLLIWSAVKTTLQGTIEWRGTHYKLSDLKAGKRVW